MFDWEAPVVDRKLPVVDREVVERATRDVDELPVGCKRDGRKREHRHDAKAVLRVHAGPGSANHPGCIGQGWVMRKRIRRAFIADDGAGRAFTGPGSGEAEALPAGQTCG